MNPWTFYEHKPLLIESVMVAGASCFALRSRDWRSGARLAATVGGAGWGVVGIADYAVYAFGYQIARWVADDIESIQSGLAWLRPLLAAIVIVALSMAMKPNLSSGTNLAGPH